MNTFLPASNRFSNSSIVNSFVVQDPYGNGQPEFMQGGIMPSSFIGRGLSGADDMGLNARGLSIFVAGLILGYAVKSYMTGD